MGSIIIAVLTAIGIHCTVTIYEKYVGMPKTKAPIANAVADETAKDGNDDEEEAQGCWTKHELTFTVLAELSLGLKGRYMVRVAMVASQMGCMMAYLIYCGTVGTQYVPSVPEWVWVLVLYPIFLAVCQLRDIKMLLDWAAIGVFISFLCMVGTFGVCLAKVTDHGVADIAIGFDITKFPTFFGVMFFAMEGITVVLPVVHTMKEPHKAHSMVFVVICGVAVSYMLVGIMGYLAYGDKSIAPMTENMPKGTFNDMLIFMRAIVVMVTFPVQCYPLTNMADEIWPESPRLIRFHAVTLPTIAAILFPYMGECVGIIGGAAMTMLGCVIPYTMYLAEFGVAMPSEKKWLLYAALAVGCLLGLLATIESTVALVEEV